MKFSETSVKGAWIIAPEPISDERGFFARSYSRELFEQHGLDPNIAQCNISFNRHRGTLRGMHYQVEPHEEVKVVRCTRGAIYDVVVDLRRESPSFMKWAGVELTSENYLQLYVPKGCAHGFVTLTDAAEILYEVSEYYHPESAHGVRWNDPAFGITWPEEVKVIIERDANYPDFRP